MLFRSSTLSVDWYNIEVDDRIYRTGGLISAIDQSAISFYTNALDVEHSGIDIVFTTSHDWNDMNSTDVSFAYGYNKIDVTGQSSVETNLRDDDGVLIVDNNGNFVTALVNPVSQGSIDNIENNFPNHRFVLTTNTSFGDDWNLLVRANF